MSAPHAALIMVTEAPVSVAGWESSGGNTVNITYSNGDRTTNIAAGGGTRSTTSHNTGKFYFEVLITTTGGVGNPSIGVKTAAVGPGGIFFAGGCWTYCADNPAYVTYPTGYQNTGIPISGGDIMAFAVDFDAGMFWAAHNNTWVLSGNPAAGTNPVTTTVPTATAMYAAIGGGAALATVNFGASQFVYTPPAGFLPW